MSYVQIEIDGIKRGLKFNNYAFNVARKKIVADDVEGTSGYAFFWGGLVANCYVKSEQPDFTFEQEVDWYDKLTTEQAEGISLAIQETQQYKDSVKTEDVTDEEKKTSVKKSTGKKHNA